MHMHYLTSLLEGGVAKHSTVRKVRTVLQGLSWLHLVRHRHVPRQAPSAKHNTGILIVISQKNDVT